MYLVKANKKKGLKKDKLVKEQIKITTKLSQKWALFPYP